MKVKHLLTSVAVLFIFGLLTTSSHAKLDLENCVGMWLLDEDEGDTATDSSGNENDGMLANGPKWVEGKFGKALEFDGGNHVEVPASEDFSYEEGYTFALYFRANNVNTQQGPIGQNANGQYINFWMNSAQLRWETDAGQNFFSSVAIEEDQWYHAAGTYDFASGMAKIYIDGEFDKEIAFSSDTDFTTIPVIIGGYGIGSYPFDGIIDEIAIFNVELAEEDIKSIATKGLGMATGIAAVDASGKLATTWAGVKSQ
jgi:concanavalin A-like lectin/glucanase superfamily protein